MPPALADRLLRVEAELLRRAGDLERARAVLAGLRQPATAAAAHAVAHLHLCEGDLAAADEALAPFPDDGATVRGRVEGALLRSLIAARHDHATGLLRLEGALIAAAPVMMRRPFLVPPPSCRTCSARGSKPAPRRRPTRWIWCVGWRGSPARRRQFRPPH